MSDPAADPGEGGLLAFSPVAGSQLYGCGLVKMRDLGVSVVSNSWMESESERKESSE